MSCIIYVQQTINFWFVIHRILLSLYRFHRFQKLLDCEMKKLTRDRVSIANKKADREAITDEEEEKFWVAGQLGMSTSKSLLNSVYYYNGKLFGLRRGEHRNITVNNFEVGSNYIAFEENVSKTFHGGLSDLKYVPRKVRHVCHEEGEKHERCLVEIYKCYMELVKIEDPPMNAFYFRPKTKSLGFAKSPVGVNTLSKILPDMCKSVGITVKTAHSLRVTCASALFQHGVDEKIIRERTGHRSNALFKYEKASKEQISNVSRILGPSTSLEKVDDTVEVVSSTSITENLEENVNVSSTSVNEESAAKNAVSFQTPYFVNCDVKFVVKKV